MKKLTQLEKFGLIAAILICGSYFYMKKIYDPEAEALKKTVSKLNQTISEYNKLEEPPLIEPLRKKLKGEMERLEELTLKMKEAGGRTGKKAEVTEVLSKITTAAKKHRMQVMKIIPGADIKEELFTWATFNLSLDGKYQDFLSLLRELQAMDQPIQFKNLEIKRNEQNASSVTIITTLLF